MSKVTPIELARNRREQLATRQYYNASPFNSPVPLLIELMEPILETVREQPGVDVQKDLAEFIEVLELSRREIDQLEDIAMFLQRVNCIDEGNGQ